MLTVEKNVRAMWQLTLHRHAFARHPREVFQARNFCIENWKAAWKKIHYDLLHGVKITDHLNLIWAMYYANAISSSTA